MAKDAGGARSNGHLTKEEFFKSTAIKERDFTLPGGGKIRLRGLNVREGAPFVAGLASEGDPVDRMKKLCLMGIIEPKLELEDLERLDDEAVGVVSTIAGAVMQLSGLVGADTADFFDETRESNSSTSTAPKRSTGSRQR